MMLPERTSVPPYLLPTKRQAIRVTGAVRYPCSQRPTRSLQFISKPGEAVTAKHEYRLAQREGSANGGYRITRIWWRDTSEDRGRDRTWRAGKQGAMKNETSKRQCVLRGKKNVESVLVNSCAFFFDRSAYTYLIYQQIQPVTRSSGVGSTLAFLGRTSGPETFPFGILKL